MNLYIDATEKESFIIALVDETRVVCREQIQSVRQHSEKLLAAIDALLAKQGFEKKDISGVAAVEGPGSFTSLRIGIATANALAEGLSVPAYALTQEDAARYINNPSSIALKPAEHNVVIPAYGRPPHITEPRKK